MATATTVVGYMYNSAVYQPTINSSDIILKIHTNHNIIHMHIPYAKSLKTIQGLLYNILSMLSKLLAAFQLSAKFIIFISNYNVTLHSSVGSTSASFSKLSRALT